MNSTEALIQLNCTFQNWEEQAMELVFEQKQYLLKSAVTPPIFTKRAERLMRIQEACDCLSDSLFTLPNQQIINLPQIEPKYASLLVFYRAYEQQLSYFKLQMMQNLEPGMVSYWVKNLAQLENDKLIALSSLREAYHEEHLDLVKLSEFVNSGEVIKELLKNEYKSEFQITLQQTPNLLKDVARSIKYVNFVKQ